MATVLTTHGVKDESELEKRSGVFEDDNEITTWVEYYLGGELVHRSAHVQLKQWPEGMGVEMAQFGQGQ